MVTETQMILRLLLAVILSGLIGLEREMHGRAAGLRTHILVCLGSTLIMITSMHVADIYRGSVNADPARIAAQVVSGIGFLGAGTIIRFRASVRGLTTAASLWSVAGVGLAVGSGLYQAAMFTTALVLGSLYLLTKFEYRFARKDWYKMLVVQTKGDPKQLQEIRETLSDYNTEMKDFNIRHTDTPGEVILEIALKLLTDREDANIISDVMSVEGVRRASWK
ncbi:MAG: MgtC/SapB family protein [Candidatus Omnitrophota bacterium]